MNRLPGWLAPTLLLLAGCTTEATKHEREFDKLLQGLPGQYDNRAQAKSDASGEHAAVALVINPVNALAIGKIVMFARETAFDDPRRVVTQHIWTFELDKTKEHLVQSVYVFKEPRRWVHALDDPYLIQSVLPDDLSPLTGCKLIWSKSDYGFAATINASDCKASAGEDGLLIEQSAELRGTDLLLNEQLSGPDGNFEGSADAASAYRFQRRSGPSQRS
ncbi:MAG TPA: CpcT/CpeT family chromophore lyase [Steroidobacteraceae bacterium]